MHLPAEGWAGAFLEATAKCKAVVSGPGSARATTVAEEIRAVLAAVPVPLVIDADALTALGDLAAARTLLDKRSAPSILTPHDGEYARLAGSAPGADRLDGRPRLAASREPSSCSRGRSPRWPPVGRSRALGRPTCCSPPRGDRRSPPPAAATCCRGSSARSGPGRRRPSRRPRWRRTCTAGRRPSGPPEGLVAGRPARPPGPAAVRVGRGRTGADGRAASDGGPWLTARRCGSSPTPRPRTTPTR